MPLLLSLREVADKSLSLKGELPVADLDVDSLDEVIHARQPLKYNLVAEILDEAVLVQGTLTLKLDCECVRCLKAFRHTLKLKGWACHLPLEGEEKVEVINDSVDLTPYLREDIVLAFPQHPLCKPDCGGLASTLKKKGKSSGATAPPAASAWAALDRLKLKK